MIKQKLIKNELFCINLLPQTAVFFFKDSIIMCGKKGRVFSSIRLEKNKCFISVKKNNISLYKNFFIQEQKIKWLEVYNLIQNLLYGINYLFSKKLIFVGIGFKTWVKVLNNKGKILLLKIGFSEDLCISVPKNIIIFPIKHTFLLIRGLEKKKVEQFSSLIKSYKKPEKYKGKGILYKNEIIFLKVGGKK
jgi:ribosomal protein L6P/L9E